MLSRSHSNMSVTYKTRIRLTDAEHPTDITMDLPPKDTRIEHSKVNSILYACSFGPLVDGILLDPPLPCILRFESYTCVMEEVGHKGTSTPSTREAWKRRRKREVQAEPRTSRSRTSGPQAGPSGTRPDRPDLKSDRPKSKSRSRPSAVIVRTVWTTGRTVRAEVGPSGPQVGPSDQVNCLRAASGARPVYPFLPPLDYKYLSPTSSLG